MNPTLAEGDAVLIHKTGKQRNREDIIVFEKDGTMMIKRIVGIPNDVVTLSKEGVRINQAIVKPYTYEGEAVQYVLAENEYFVIGDNYMVSLDSREYGPVSEEMIVGKVIWMP